LLKVQKRNAHVSKDGTWDDCVKSRKGTLKGLSQDSMAVESRSLVWQDPVRLLKVSSLHWAWESASAALVTCAFYFFTQSNNILLALLELMIDIGWRWYTEWRAEKTNTTKRDSSWNLFLSLDEFGASVSLIPPTSNQRRRTDNYRFQFSRLPQGEETRRVYSAGNLRPGKYVRMSSVSDLHAAVSQHAVLHDTGSASSRRL